MKKLTKKTKRRLRILTLCIFGVIAFVVSSVYHDWKQIFENQKQTKNLSYQYQNLLNEEQNLNSEVTKFQDPEYIARYAREKFLYSLPDELIIKIPKK